MILYQDCLSHHDSSKIMTARGGACFPFVSLHFKTLLVRNHRNDFNITWQKCSFGDPLPRLFKPSAFMIYKKTRGVGRGRCGGRCGEGFFSLCVYIEKFTNILVRHPWTNSNIIFQKCFFGGPLPRLFKPHDSSKIKVSLGGWGFYFPYVSI